MIGDEAGTSVEDGEAVALTARSAKIAAQSKGQRGQPVTVMVMKQGSGDRASRMASTNGDRRKLARSSR
jgi:hypothetical protein